MLRDYQLPDHPAPILVQLGLTYRCNLKCQHCYALYRRDLNEMTFDELSRLLADLYAMGSCAIVYSHGENLIRKDFHNFASLVNNYGMYQTLMTNGFYIRTKESAERLRDTGVNRVLVSLDSSVPAEHDASRGYEGAYYIALDAAQMLKQVGIATVGFSTTIDAYNYDRIPDIIQIAKDFGLDAVSLMQNRYNRPGVFDHNQWIRYVQVCRQVYELILQNRGIIDIYTHDPFMLIMLDDRLDDRHARIDYIGANVCNVATNMISIDPIGNVTGCNFLEEVVGNVRMEPLGVIWERLVQRYSDSRNKPGGPCESCTATAVCMGGCKAFHYNGKYDERCGECRFGEEKPHNRTPLMLPLYPTESSPQCTGNFSRAHG